MADGKAFLTPEEIRPLAERSDMMGFALIAYGWALVFGAVALFAWYPSVVTFLLAVMIIGSRQLGFAVLMHEGAHRALFKTGWLNEWASQWLASRPIMGGNDQLSRLSYDASQARSDGQGP